MRRMAVTTGTGVDTDTLTLRRRESPQRKVVQVDKAVEQKTGRIELHREPPFREVDLDLACSFLQTPTNLGLMLAQEVVDEFVPRVSGKLIGGIHEAQYGWGKNRVVERLVRVEQGDIEKTVRVALVTKRAAGQPRHAARMAVRKRNLKSVCGRPYAPHAAVDQRPVS